MSNGYPREFEFCRQGVSIVLEEPDRDENMPLPDFFVAGVPIDNVPGGGRPVIKLVILESQGGKYPDAYPGKVTLKVGYYKHYEIGKGYSVTLYPNDSEDEIPYDRGDDYENEVPFFNGYSGYFKINFDHSFPDPRIGVG